MSEPDKYAEVAPLSPLSGSARQAYTYLVPAETALFERVKIPFGRRFITGIVMSWSKRPIYAVKQAQVLDAARLTPTQVALGSWIAHTMNGGLGFSLKLFFPSEIKKKKNIARPAAPKNLPLPAFFKKMSARPAVLLADSRQRYMREARLIQKALKQKRQALVIVPEIKLIEEVAAVLSQTIPEAQISRCQSGRSAKRETDLWRQVWSGEPVVVIGTQKALFLPYQSLALVVVEAEAYHTHKLWDAYPRLDNRLGAAQLAKFTPAALVFAGSWPSLNLYWQTQNELASILINKPQTSQAEVIGSGFDDRRRGNIWPKQAVGLIRYWLKNRDKIFVLASAGMDKIAQELSAKLSTKVGTVSAQQKKVTAFNAAKAGRAVVGTEAAWRYLPAGWADHVVWVEPERVLTWPDWRGRERAWYLLNRLQAVTPSKKVLLVTKYRRLVEAAFHLKLSASYELDLNLRQRYLYPPFADLAVLVWRGADAKKNWRRAQLARERQDVLASADIIVRGPFKMLSRDGQEARLLLKGKLPELAEAAGRLKPDVVDVWPENIF